MTLNEYITQSEPQANVKVILQEGEYIQRDAIKVAPFSVHTAVDIPAIAEHYGIKDNYIRIGTARQLFTRHPQTGELRGSMFFLPDDAPEPPELTQFLRFLKANEVFLKQWCEAHPVRGGSWRRKRRRGGRAARAEPLERLPAFRLCAV